MLSSLSAQCGCHYRYVSACQDVAFIAPDAGAALNETRSWQYVYQNGAYALFEVGTHRSCLLTLYVVTAASALSYFLSCLGFMSATDWLPCVLTGLCVVTGRVCGVCIPLPRRSTSGGHHSHHLRGCSGAADLSGISGVSTLVARSLFLGFDTLLQLHRMHTHLMCSMLQFYITKQCYGQQMRRFSVFLGLPSATVRAMVAKQLKVSTLVDAMLPCVWHLTTC